MRRSAAVDGFETLDGGTYYRSLAAENAIDAGRLDTALAILDAALEQAATTGECYWEPQLLRLRARIAVAAGEPDATAVALLEAAAARAAAMGAHMLEALALVDLRELDGPDAAREARLGALLGEARVELPAEAAARVAGLGGGMRGGEEKT